MSLKKNILLIAFLSLGILFLTSQTSDRINDIHIFPLEEISVDNTNGSVKLYFRLEKAKLINPDWKNDGSVVRRESPTTGRSGYFLVEPLPNLTTKEITVFESPKGENKFIKITSYESDLKITSDPKEAKIYSILLMDVSGSITRSVDGKKPPVLNELKKAAKIFVDKLNLKENRELAVYAFDGREELIPIIDFTSDTKSIIENIDKINTGITEDLSTNLYGAIVKVSDIMDKKFENNQSKLSITSGTITVFTDGTDRAKRLGKNGESIVLKTMSDLKAKRKNIYYYTIGLGRDYDEKKLRELGSDSYQRALTTGVMQYIFNKLAERIDNLTKCYYRLEYKTPSRKGAGITQLIIDVKKDAYWGGYRITFDTANFTF